MNPTSFRSSRILAALACSSALVLLGACGGGGTEAPPPSAGARAAALYFTDDFSADYKAVWVSISRVSVVSANGTETQLLSFSPSLRLNLPTLKNAGNWAGNAQIPADAVAIRVHVEAKAQLQQQDGRLLDVSLTPPGGYLSFSLSNWNPASGALALDFDLPRFTLQGTTLVAATRVADDADLSRWNHRETEVKGTVSAISASSITLDAGPLGKLVFALDGSTRFVSTDKQGWRPVVGDAVEINAVVSGQGASLELGARSIKQREARDSAASRSEIKAVVLAINGNMVKLQVQGSHNGGPLGELSLDLSAARFEQGSLASLQVGMELEVYLQRQGELWVAKVVDIEGMAAGGPNAIVDDYSEVKARVLKLEGQTLTVRIIHAEDLPAAQPGTSLTVDLSKAVFKKTSPKCLLSGVPVELKGFIDQSGAFQLLKIEGESACAAAIPVSGVQPPSAEAELAALNGKTVKVEGTLIALRSDGFELLVYSLEDLASAPAQILVRIETGTLFDDVTAKTLKIGQYLEIKGRLQDGWVSAAKIKRD